MINGTSTISTLRPYSPGGPLNTYAPSPQTHVEFVTTSGQRLQRGLHGYLIRFAPHAFVPHCQTRSRWAPSPPVVLRGLKDLTPTHRIPPPPPDLKFSSFPSMPDSLLPDFTRNLINQLRTL